MGDIINIKKAAHDIKFQLQTIIESSPDVKKDEKDA
jgi:hypothetical protein